MFSSIRRARLIFAFLTDRFGDYAALARFDMAIFRRELIRSMFGVGICAAASMALLCFICIAILVTNWNTGYRILTAWLICAGWALLVLAATFYARRSLRHSSPFGNIGLEISRDLAAIKEPANDAVGTQPG